MAAALLSVLSSLHSRQLAHCESSDYHRPQRSRRVYSVTSVGATTGFPETAASFSAGGFSNFFPPIDNQSAVISPYLTKLGRTNIGRFSTTGRGFPDLAAMADEVEMVFEGSLGFASGVEVSLPIIAATFTLLNDRLLAAGRPQLGFLNPFLYGPAVNAFTDITTGNNPGCGTNGFPAAVGWDPVGTQFRAMSWAR